MLLAARFERLGTDNAPGQEIRQNTAEIGALLCGDVLTGQAVDFSHGDVDAHEPTPGALEFFNAGVARGGEQAYTEYRGGFDIRAQVAAHLADFTGAPVNALDELILTPGTQGALFLAVASCVSRGVKVAIVQPDYFANRKLVEFFEGEMIPVHLAYRSNDESCAGIHLGQLEDAFKAGARVFLFSNPNNPTGVVYSAEEIARIAELADRYGATVIIDQLYSRLLYSGSSYTHLRAHAPAGLPVITIMGPSKTESLSGYRLGAAFGPADLVARMEKVQAIVSLRAAGYSQAVLRSWFREPKGWMEERIRQHQLIRDDLLQILHGIDGAFARKPQAGSYIFPRLPPLRLSAHDFVKALRIQAGLIVTIGTEFSPHAGDSVRLNFSQDHDAAVAAVERLAIMVERYRA